MKVTTRAKYRLYDKYYFCSCCRRWIPKDQAELSKGKIKRPICPYCHQNLRTKRKSGFSLPLIFMLGFIFFFFILIQFTFMENIYYCLSIGDIASSFIYLSFFIATLVIFSLFIITILGDWKR